LRLLIDTHVLLWWLLGSEALATRARAMIADAENETFVSAASAWELSIKYKLGKLPTAAPLMANLPGAIVGENFAELPITVRHAQQAANLPMLHKDPFDRMLIAQALAESLVLVSNERLFDAYGVARLW
jgi:PIN domain nuclease of toxin-antitoxin system